MPDQSWKGLRQHEETVDRHGSPPDALNAIQAARETMGKYGFRVPLDQWFVRQSTIDELRQTELSVCPMGLGIVHVEGELAGLPQ